MIIEIIVSPCYGPFEPSKEYAELLKKKGYKYWGEMDARLDKDLIEFVKQKKAEGVQTGKNYWQYVGVEEVDTDIPWTIGEYDGAEGIDYIKYEVVRKDINYCEMR